MRYVAFALAAVLLTPACHAQEHMEPSVAPELEGGLGWLNTDRPLKLADLRGQVVVLDFWTYCCINCMHVLPILHDLEVRHKNDPFVVIGVHSAKFVSERDPDRIREAILRYGITHPVYVDQNMTVWDKYGISSWPTLVIIRPNGRIAAIAPGEADPAVLEAFVTKVMNEARADGTLAKAKYVIHRPPAADTGPLSFPGKIQAGPDGRLFVSDSGHHRVLVMDRSGKVLDTIGSGLKGVRAGGFAEAAFDDPEGLALDGDRLYIADARGHVILRADLTARTVTRVAGVGKLGLEPLDGPMPALETPLRSPWALALNGRKLYFSAAGSHQIGVLDLDGGTVARFAGNGREAIVDGPADKASFAQTSGLAIHDGTLYTADSESSSIRAIDLATGATRTLVGTGLFDFGDQDGPVKAAKLQHPLGVAWTSAGLVVADTYNNKLKLFTPDLHGIGALSIRVDGKAPAEPGGLGVDSEGALLVADTNNHRILRVPIRAGHVEAAEASALSVTNAPAPSLGVAEAAAAEVVPSAPPPDAAATLLAPQSLGGGQRTLTLMLKAPPDFELNDQAPYEVSFEISQRSDLVRLDTSVVRSHQSGPPNLRVSVPIHVEPNAPAGNSEITAHIRAVICDAKHHAACYPLHDQFRLPLRLGQGGADATFEAQLASPKR